MNELYKIMFIDIETVPVTNKLEELSMPMQELWTYKFAQLKRRMPDKYNEEDTAVNKYLQNAGIFAEFGRIVCISVGFIYSKNNINHLRIKSFADKNEKKLLTDFIMLLDTFFTTSEHYFCGHNIKEFDIPFLCRRMIINQIKLPQVLQIHNKKPWEINLLDTMDFWKFGDYKSYTSLKLLSEVLGVPTSKDDIDGSQVAEVFYKEDNLKRIVTYCEKDVVTTTRVWLRLIGESTIENDNITFVKEA